MCRPGYRWNSTLKRCLGMGGGGGDTPEPPKPPEPPTPPVEPPPSEGEIPVAPVMPVNTGRGDVRVNANGVVQTGTSMGKASLI